MRQIMNNKINILVVDDNLADLMLIEEALKESDMQNEINIISIDSGEKAINLLKEGQQKVDIMLLDLNMPKITGQEVLKFVKEHPKLKDLPVLIFTSSNYEKDVEDAYLMQANGYLIKPMEYKEFLELIKKIKKFWLSVVSLPTS